MTRAATPVLLPRSACAPPPGVTCHQPPWARQASAAAWGRQASAAALLALARWHTPDLPLYDDDRGDFAP